MNHLDTIGKLPEIKLCVGYKDENGVVTTDYTTNTEKLEKMTPVYETFEGNFDACGIRKYAKLPEKAKTYVKAIEEFIGIPIGIIGTGPDREDMIVR